MEGSVRIQESTAVRGGRVVNLIRVTSLAAVPSLEGESKKGKRERGRKRGEGKGEGEGVVGRGRVLNLR